MLLNRYLNTILLSTFFLQLGIWVRNIAILLYVVDQTDGNGFAVSMISVAEFLPIFVFSFIGGAFADRWNPKRTMIWCDVLSAASILFVMLAFMFGTWKSIFFATLVSSVLSQFSQPSGMKLFKKFVPPEQIQASMSMFQTVIAVFMVLGPMVGTFFYQQFGIQVCIGVMGVSFILSAIVLTKIPADIQPERSKESGLLKEMKAGIAYMASNRLLRYLGISFTVSGLGVGLVVPLGIFVITDRLRLPEAYFQWIAASKGIGMILGGALSLALSKRVSSYYLLTAGFAVNAVCLMVAGISTRFWLTFSAEFFIGFVTPAFQVAIQTLVLKNTDEAFVGRVNGILTPLFMGSMVLTMSFAGWLKDLWSVFMMYEVAASLFLISTCITIPLIRQHLKSTIHEPVGQQTTT